MTDTVQHPIFSIWIFTKKKSLLIPALKREKFTGHSDAKAKPASQERKAGDNREEGSTEGMLRARAGGGRCKEGDVGWHRERYWQVRPCEREVSLRRRRIPSLEITSRNLQT